MQATLNAAHAQAGPARFAQQDVSARVRQVVADTGGYLLEEIQAADTFRHTRRDVADGLGFDSRDVAMVLVACNAEFGVELPADPERMVKVQDLIDAVQHAVGQP
jgi:acyl carrier protein